MKKIVLFSITILSVACMSFYTYKPEIKGLSNKQIEYVLESQGTLSDKSQEGYWEVFYKDRTLIVITNEASDRMRIMTPVVERKNIKTEQYFELLEAQYHSTLDTRYALHNNVLWSVYAHPLDELTRKQLTEALSQVYYSAENFGTTYLSTGDLVVPKQD